MKKSLVLLVIVFTVLSIFAKTQLVFWGFMMNDEHAKKVLEGFVKENPDIDVTYVQLSWSNGFDKIVTAIASGEKLDVVELGNTWVANFAANQTIAQMDDFYKKFGKQYLGWDTCKFGKNYWAVPWLLGTRALFYNMDLFKAAGLNPDTPPETWDELLEAASRISKLKNTYGFGMCAGENYSPWQQWFLPAIWGTGADIISTDGKKALLNQPKVRQAAEFYQKLSKYSLKSKQSDLAKAFGEGKIGIYVSGAWDIDYLETNYPKLAFNVALLPRPSKTQGTHASFAGAEVLAILSHSKQKQAAQKLVEYLIRPSVAMEIAKIWPAIFPSHVDAGKDPWFEEHPMHRVFYEQNKYAKPVPAIPQWPKIEDILTEFVEELVIKNADVNSLILKYNQRIQNVLDGK